MSNRPRKSTSQPSRKSKPATRALTRRPSSALARGPEPPLPAPLSDSPMLGALGMTEIKFTPAEELVLAKAVNIADVRIKPSGQPYISHPSYTRWFNDAFGRGGWNIVPVAKPMQNERGIICPYVLYIHGKPAAFAFGEQDITGSGEQTIGDAFEATVASALRRCAKRLGIGLELWDKEWLDNYVRTHCVRVMVKGRDGQQRVQWRRAVDPRFYNELGQAGEVEQRAPHVDARPAQRQAEPQRQTYSSSSETQPVTEKQLGRLWAISNRHGWSRDEVHMYLKRAHGIDSASKITRRNYDDICAVLELGPRAQGY